MASLPNLPVELLFLIYSFMPSHKKDLLALSLVCQKLRPSAQKVLHHTIEINQPQNKPGFPSTKSQVPYLLRTLIARPDLAASVRKFKIVVIKQLFTSKWAWEKKDAPQEVDFKNWDNTYVFRWPTSIRRLCQDYLKYQKYCNQTWMQHIRDKYEPGLVGLLIALMPCLESLWIRFYNSSEYMSGLKRNGGFLDINHFSTRAGHFSTRSFFGVHAQDFDPNQIPGLKNLKAIHVHSEIPGQILNLDTLRSAKFRLQRIPRCMTSSIGNISSSSNITTLIVHLDIAILEDQFDLVDAKYQYMQRFIVSLKKLTCLGIYLYTPPWSQNTRIEPWAGYDKTLALIQSKTLKTLVIDEADIDWSKRRWDNSRPGATNYDIPAATTLHAFPKLERVVAPSAFFFNTFKSDQRSICKRCKLPATVTSLEIIDPLQNTELFAQHLLDFLGIYKGLRKFRLWYDVQNIHLVADDGLENLFLHRPDISFEDAQAIYLATKESRVWSLLKERGIEVVEDWKTPRGWRIACD